MQRRHRGCLRNWAADRLTAEEEAEYKAIMRSFLEDARARAAVVRHAPYAGTGEIERGGADPGCKA